MSDTAAAGPIGLGVKLPFNTSAEFVARYRDNVTRGGIYLRAKKVLPPGTMVNLDLKLTTGERLLHGSAVVHFVSGQQGTGPSGIGLKFLELDAASQNFLGEMLANHPGAFADAPPVPNGVGPVQYAERPADDAAVTRVMTVPSDLLGAAVPLPSSAPPAVASPPQTTSTGSFFAANWAPPPVAAPPMPVAAPSAIHSATTPAGGVPLKARVSPGSGPHPQPSLLDRLEDDAGDAKGALGGHGEPSASGGSDSRGLSAARALIAGDVAGAYAEGVDSEDPVAKAFALGAAVAAAVDSKSADWASRAKQLAEAGAGLPFQGNRWALVAHAAHAAGDQKTVRAALDALAKEDARHPLVAAGLSAAPEPSGRKGVGIPVAALLLVLGLGGGYAGGMFLGGGSTAAKPAPVAAKPAASAPAAPKPAATKPAEPAKTETAAATKPATDDELPESLTPDAAKPAATETAATDKAAADKAAADKAIADKAAADKATAERIAVAEKAAAEKAAAGKAAAEKAAAGKAAAEKAAAEKAAAEKLAAEKAAADKAAAAKATAAKATATGTTQTASTTKSQLSAEEKQKLAAAEAVTLRKAETALDNEENCEPYLEPLAGIVASNASVPNMGKAIILRARCYDATDRTSLARKEYRKYLSWFPRGPFVDEAREANEQ